MIINSAMVAKAAKALDVDAATLTSATLGAAYKAAAKKCHPDAHDKPAQWQEINWAKTVLLEHLDKNVVQHITGDCRACHGTGRVATSKRSFGGGLTMMCVMCRGSGNLGEENG